MTYLPFFALSLYIVKIDVGHSVTISAGGLQVTYNIDQFHFHWGENSSVGSEHTIDSQHYPLEVRNMIMTQLTQTKLCILRDINIKLSNISYCEKTFFTMAFKYFLLL